MRTIVKSFLITYIVAVVAVCVSCSSKPKLETLVKEENKQCPIPMGVSGSVSSFTYDNGKVIIEFLLDENTVPISSIEEDKEAARESLLEAMSMLQDDLKAVYEEIVKEKATLVYKYVGDMTKEVFTFEFTPEEVDFALKQDAGDVDYEEVFAKQIETLKEQCPRRIDALTTLDSVTVNERGAVYNYTIDDDSIDISVFMESSDKMRQGILNGIYQNQSTMSLFLVSCSKLNAGLYYRYVGKKSGKEFSIDFDSKFISELVK